MIDDTQQTQPITDVEIITEPTPETGSGAEILINLEQSIKSNIAGIDSRKNELRKLKEMMASALTNDETYRIQDEDVKKFTKIRNATRQEIMKIPANRQLVEKIKDLMQEVKEMDGALSDYLREYQRLSGTNEIETDEGEVREIVYTARLIKKAMKFK